MIRIDITNVRPGEETADYLVTLTIPEDGRWKTYNAKVSGYDRRLGWAPLAHMAVDKLAETKTRREAIG